MEDESGATASSENNIEESLLVSQNEKLRIAGECAIEYQQRYNHQSKRKLVFPKRHSSRKNLEDLDKVFVHKMTIKEAHKEDVGRYIVRIDRSSLILMGLKVGDIVVVKGNNGRKTAAKCLDSMLLEFESIIRMDKVMRYNLGMQIDDIIDSKSVAKANNIYSSNSHTYKEEIVLEPLTTGIPASVDEQYVARALEGVPVVKGQAVLVPYYGGSWFQYAVLDIRKATGMEEEEKTEILASEISVMVGPDTSIIFEGKAG